MSKTAAHQRYRLQPTDEWPKGRIVPGVTTIVGVLNKPALVPWANKLGLQGIEVGKYVDDKADIGTLAHDMIICELQGRKADTSDYSKNQIDSAENACLSFYEWQKKHRITIIRAEDALVSEIYEFGGRYDMYAEVDGVFELLDLKTGSGIWEEHYYQLGGYLLLMEEENLPVKQCRILNIPRAESENFQEIVVSEQLMAYGKEMFLDCLRVYNRKKLVNKAIKK